MSCVILFLIGSFPHNSYSCFLTKKVLSLSGPFSFALKELGLSEDSNLLGVSQYHHFLKHKHKINGGIYLSSKELYKYKENYQIFMDESFELKRNLERAKLRMKNIQKVISISSRGVKSDLLSQRVFDEIKKVSRGCDQKIKKIMSFTQRVVKNSKKLQFDQPLFFALSNASSKKGDRLLLTNDLFITSLRENTSFSTYSSTKAYSTLSQKRHKINKVKKTWIYLKQDLENPLNIKDKVSHLEISGRAVLTPGLSQIYLLDKFNSFFLRYSLKNKKSTTQPNAR